MPPDDRILQLKVKFASNFRANLAVSYKGLMETKSQYDFQIDPINQLVKSSASCQAVYLNST